MGREDIELNTFKPICRPPLDPPEHRTMEHALNLFHNQLPTLSQLKAHNKDSGIPPEAAWIWGKDDEVGWACNISMTAC